MNNKNESAKNVKNVNTKKEKVTKLNLSQFANLTSVKNAKENVKNVKETIYIYPENFNKADIDSPKGKSFRSAQRNKRNRFCDAILSATKINDSEILQKEIKNFISFYKVTYIKNDFSVSSISNKSDAVKNKDLADMFTIIKTIQKIK